MLHGSRDSPEPTTQLLIRGSDIEPCDLSIWPRGKRNCHRVEQLGAYVLLTRALRGGRAALSAGPRDRGKGARPRPSPTCKPLPQPPPFCPSIRGASRWPPKRWRGGTPPVSAAPNNHTRAA